MGYFKAALASPAGADSGGISLPPCCQPGWDRLFADSPSLCEPGLGPGHQWVLGAASEWDILSIPGSRRSATCDCPHRDGDLNTFFPGEFQGTGSGILAPEEGWPVVGWGAFSHFAIVVG